ncbi:hypothetical protein ACOMHN_023527 [Nucella lapillus]
MMWGNMPMATNTVQFQPAKKSVKRTANFANSTSSTTTAELMDQLRDLSAKYSQIEKVTADIQSQNTSLRKDLMAVQNKGAKTRVDVTALQKEVTSLRGDLTSQRQDVANLEDKHFKMSQDSPTLLSDFKALQRSHKKLKSDHEQLHTDTNILQKDLTKLQSDHDTLQTSHKTLKMNHAQLETDAKTLKTDVTKLQSEPDQAGARLTKVQGGVPYQTYSKLQTDPDSLVLDLWTLKASVEQLEDRWKKDASAIIALESRLNKARVTVAFQARLWQPVKASRPQTIVCNNVLTNVGGAYNNQTGVFTAPVSGTYCFLATATPASDGEANTEAALVIVKGEDNIVGSLEAWGRGRGTTHCVVPVQAGKTVRLRTFHGKRQEISFDGNLETCFTGMLLQQDT